MTVIYTCCLLLEAQSPMAINSGGREIGFDTQLARDANGLPYLPATALAGVWRHLANQELQQRWFGSLDEHSDASRLIISDGVIHDSHNCPVTGLRPLNELEQDPILSLLLQERPHHRERVRINDRGVASHEGKFDQILLPAGVRFSVNIHWRAEQREPELEAEWQELLACWQVRRFALGASTRNGLGQIKVIAHHSQYLDLVGNPAMGQRLSDFIQRKVRPSQPLAMERAELPFATLPLKALGAWRCGRGETRLGSEADSVVKGNGGQTEQNDHIGSFTYSERRINWDGEHASISAPQPVLCGSAIKGILGHRLAYHYRRLTQNWAEEYEDIADNTQWEKRPEELWKLLGNVEPNSDSAVAGRLYVDDIPIAIKPEHTHIRRYNSIDRFTGGVRQGKLYSEELLYQPCFELRLWLAPDTYLSQELQQALEYTLDDLREGRLPLGAGSGRGASLVQQDWQGEWLVNIPQLCQEKETV
ncbi:hypothetical protein C9426_32700 [Serratia sp. S1B]|nr:hypothetical protein C9426_32700 [Serratia sp. S1B]